MNRRGAEILLAKSSISGWGAFTKKAAEAGDYIGEYVGEVISQEEADRRGQLADAMNSSYLFLLASNRVVDAARKGNLTRFINHSDDPNAEPRSK